MSKINYLDFSSDVYQTTISDVIADVFSPVCPFTTSPQFYDKTTKQCIQIPTEALTAPTSGNCGLFQLSINNTCYNTNDCYVAPDSNQTCLNGQRVTVSEHPFAGRSVYNGYA